MRLNRLDLNLLVALDALLTERSITRAAERIHLSQPATSGALARLREFFGDEILIRVGAQMLPTPLGESLAAPVHNILLQIQTTVDRGLEFIPQESDRRFRILLSDHTVSTIINPLVRHLAKVAPLIELELMGADNQPKEKLEQGEVDFLMMPKHLISENHPSSTIFEEGFVCVGWEENPALASNLTAEDFLQLGHVSVRFGSSRQPSQDQVLLSKLHGIEPKTEIITSTFNSIPPLLVETQRIAICYEKLAMDWTKLLPLKASPLPFELPKVSWGLQWHKLRDLDPGIQWMQNQIITVAKSIENSTLV
jgi:LysR family nod box-dependent transcriptional activator